MNRPLSTCAAACRLYFRVNPIKMASSRTGDRREIAGNIQYIVGHDTANKEFYIKLDQDSKDKAILQYDLIRKGIVDIQHTGVPETYRGKGIAKILVKAALDHFVAEDMRIRLSCWYAKKYVDDNPVAQYTDRVVP